MLIYEETMTQSNLSKVLRSISNDPVEFFTNNQDVVSSQVATRIQDQSAVIIVPWILEQDFKRLISRYPSYTEWFEGINGIIAEYKEKLSSPRIIKIIIKPEEFNNWCARCELPLTIESQAAFALAQFKTGTFQENRND